MNESNNKESSIKHMSDPEDLEMTPLNVDVSGWIQDENDKDKHDTCHPDTRSKVVPYKILHTVRD